MKKVSESCFHISEFYVYKKHWVALVIIALIGITVWGTCAGEENFAACMKCHDVFKSKFSQLFEFNLFSPYYFLSFSGSLLDL